MAAARLNRFANQVAPNRCAAAGGDKLFENVPVAPPDAIFKTAAAYAQDPAEQKINLGVGAYRDNNNQPVPLKVVRKVEAAMAADAKLHHEYLPITGDPEFATLARELLLGSNGKERVASVQTISGTGSLRVAAEFLKRFVPGRAVYVSRPTWGNHDTILQHAGIEVRKYRYWDAKNLGLDLAGMLEDLQKAQAPGIVLLHACAHNPTGVDPTQEQWKQIAAVLRGQGHLPWFDCAYQGFATGSLEDDAWAVRYFLDQGFPMVVCQSFAKNMGLYGERVGALHVVTGSAQQAVAVKSQLATVIRPMYSNPPSHGARVAKRIMADPALFAEWKAEMKAMSDRIRTMRYALHDELKRLGTPGNVPSTLINQIGMFSFTGLSVAQCEALIKKWHIYLLTNGRISLAGLNDKNVGYMAKAVHDVVTNY